MPILATDEITFHLEFYKGDAAPTEGLFRDGFECIMSKDLTSSNWNVEGKDIFIRDTGVEPTGVDSLP